MGHLVGIRLRNEYETGHETGKYIYPDSVIPLFAVSLPGGSHELKPFSKYRWRETPVSPPPPFLPFLVFFYIIQQIALIPKGVTMVLGVCFIVSVR